MKTMQAAYLPGNSTVELREVPSLHQDMARFFFASKRLPFAARTFDAFTTSTSVRGRKATKVSLPVTSRQDRLSRLVLDAENSKLVIGPLCITSQAAGYATTVAGAT